MIILKHWISRIMNFAILSIILIITEVGCSFCLLLIDSTNYKGNFDAVMLWNFWRVIFFGWFYIILYFLLFRNIKSFGFNRPVILSIYNLIIYIVLSYLAERIWGRNVPLSTQALMFWVTSISVFISPIILGQIAYTKRLMKNL